MSSRYFTPTPQADPIDALLAQPENAVLAVITRVEGPSYRPLGATMAIMAGSPRVGSLSSGCVESDIALHAQEVLKTGKPETFIYGRGSPFLDISLPCGGGLHVLLLPNPDKTVLEHISNNRLARQPCTLRIDTKTGVLECLDAGETGQIEKHFQIRFLPEIRFLIFGKGPEAGTFATLVQSAGYPNILLSPDQETLAFGAAVGCDSIHLKAAVFPSDISVDRWTAIILFFHDHEWEPPILTAALPSPAFYIGAQGSQRAKDVRLLEMEGLGCNPTDLGRLRGPIGLVRSVRDARTLAVSVLAEVLAVAQENSAF